MNKDDILKENCFPVIPIRLNKIKYCKRSPTKEHDFVEVDRWFMGMKKVAGGYIKCTVEEYPTLPKDKKMWGSYFVTYRCKYCKKKKIEIENLV